MRSAKIYVKVKTMKKLSVLFSSLAIALALALSGCGNSSQSDFPVEEDPDGYVDNLNLKGVEGNILQAFCWKFSDIKNNLPAIRDAGFKVVQTSPVQEPKNGGPSWWSYYQPVSFTVAQNSGLGTRQDLQDLCVEAEKYGIKIIADIVFNHLANINDDELEADGTPKVLPDVANYEPYIYEHRNDSGDTATFHHNPNAKGSGAITQVYSFGKLPDLNTANPYVQERSLALLKECIDLGIDGFRFDAAKHIETPNDPQYASDFWPNVLGVAKTYYQEKTGEELIAYGEILNDVDGGRSIDFYTQYMKVCDNSYISNVSNASINGNAQKAVDAEYGKNTDPKNLVTWAESHDTYSESSTHLGNKYIARQYAVLASRKDSVAMFLARPDDKGTVGHVDSYYYEDLIVGAINRFHNRFIGYEENQIAEENIYINERYLEDTDPVGAMVVSMNGKCTKEVTFTKLGTGVYYDQITGTPITVRNNKAEIEFDTTGVVVLTKSKNIARPFVELDNRGATFTGTIEVNISTKNTTSVSYQINDENPVTVTTKKATATLGDVKDKDGRIKLSITAKNDQFEAKRTYYYRYVDVVPGYFNVVNINPTYFTNNEIYIWCWSKGVDGRWQHEYTVQDGILLIDLATVNYTSFLLGLFAKDYVITNVNKWDSNVISQTADIDISSGLYDASSL